MHRVHVHVMVMEANILQPFLTSIVIRLGGQGKITCGGLPK